MNNAIKWDLGVETTKARAIKQNGIEFGQNYPFSQKKHVGAEDGIAN
jgi:hypothetical protein